ncbi:hypothetical protein M9458_006412, partial [Cirrhinus mrigala]
FEPLYHSHPCRGPPRTPERPTGTQTKRAPANFPSLMGISTLSWSKHQAAHHTVSISHSESSLPTTMEEGLSFIVSTTQPLLDTLLDDRASLSTETLRPSPPAGQSLQTTRGHQRSKSSCERDINAGRTRQGSNEDVGMVRCGSNLIDAEQPVAHVAAPAELSSAPVCEKVQQHGQLRPGDSHNPHKRATGRKKREKRRGKYKPNNNCGLQEK